MSRLKNLAKLLPTPLRAPVRDAWRKIRGNPELHVLHLLSDPDKLALDIGANYGTYAYSLARRAKGCVAFEPNPRLAALIEQKSRSEGLNSRVHACALSDTVDEVQLSIPVVDGVEIDALATIEADNQLSGAEIRRHVVPCRRLDDFPLDPVGVVKIDAEGHELAVLRGATALIARDRPGFLVEVEERHKPGALDQIKGFFSDLGYEGFFLLGRRLRPIDEFDLARHQDPSSVEMGEVLFDRVYVNNFVFACDRERVDRLGHIARSGRSL
jgi:FkbM family methyltransferase